MAETIKGINVVIGAETTGLSKALSEVNKQSRNIQSELRQVNKALKFDPSNTTLLAQKQALLGESVENTRGKLEQLRNVQQQVERQFANGDISAEQYRAFQREIVNSESRLRDLERQLRDTDADLQSFGVRAAEVGNKLTKIGGSISSAGKSVTMGVTVPLVGAAAAAVKVGNDFETSMSQAAGALDKPMSQMTSLRELALKTGQDTQFSATEAGNAITELAKGGLTEAQIKGGSLKATMDLAAASSMDLGTAANTVVQAMGAFGLSANQSSQAVNALAGAAAASSTDVQPLSEGLAQCAAQANLVGWSIQDTTAVLGEFADAGVVGSDAGTSLKTMLQRLGAPTDTAAAAMEGLGINVWDSNGHMKDASGIAQELQSKMSGLSDAQKQAAMNTIFGSDATRAASILMNEGASGLQKYTKATNDQTAASRLAKSQMGETSKSIEQMFGALETAAIKIQETLAPIITSIANKIGNLATAFSNLSPAVKKIILIVAGIVAAIGPLLMILGPLLITIGTVAGAIGVVTTGAAAATPAVAGLAAVFTALTGPVGIAIAAITAVAGAALLIRNYWTPITTFFNNLWVSITTIFAGIKTSIVSAWQYVYTTVISVVAAIVTSVTTFFTNLNNALMAHQTAIRNTAIILGTIFGPSLIMSATQAAIAGAQIAASFIASIVSAGIQATVSAAQITASFVASMAQAAASALVSGAQVTASFIASVIAAGAQAVVSAAAIVGSFVASLITTAAQAIATGAAITGNLIVAVVSYAAEGWLAVAAITAQTAAWLAQKVQVLASTTAMIAHRVATVALTAASKAMMVAQLALNAAFLATPFGWVAAAIGIVIAAGIALYKNWDTVSAKARATWAAIKAAFAPLAAFAKEAFGWGADLVNGFVNGIKSGFGAIGDAIGWIADKVYSLLHHTTPDEGPLKDDDKWMPDMMKNLADGIKNNTGIVMSAINNLVKGISNKTSLIKDELTSVNSWLSDFTDALKNGLNDAAFYLNNSAIKLGTALADAVMPERTARTKYFDDYNNGVITADRAITELDGSISQLQNSTGDYETDLRNLMGVMTHQSTQVNILTSEYNKLAAQFGTNSDKAIEALKKVQDLRDAYQKTGKDIKELTEKFKDALIDDVNDVNDKIKDSLKQRYEDEKSAAEKQIKLATDTQTKILQAKIDAISDQESQLDSQYQDEDDADKEAELRRQLNMHWGAEKKKELQDELNDLIKTRERRHQKEELDQQKQSLQDQIDQLKEQQETSLSNIDDFYDQKLSDANLEAEAEKTLMNSTQQELVALLHSYGEDYKLAGQDLGTRLVEGFKEPLSNLQSMFDNLKNALSEIQNAGVIPTSASFQNAASSLNLAAAATTGTQSINLEASQPAVIITKTYLDSKQVAESTTPYTSRIQGKNIVLNGRGL
ncbi:phage tail tape measure protein [Clostridium kluyveri]|uniref:phage tail tape measure protein n=1 Tax=Clostridium kluyveri TaxID=1534 RepID=UPI00224874FE|nr:phage tail tape measure protein [Clostridium kluyveri]UZQ51584.1 phage tail tape measure protein [Clostridium kluyveri]